MAAAVLHGPAPAPPVDPPVARGDRCYVCGKKRPAVAVKHDDPFCSTECCRLYYRPLVQRLGLLPKPGTLAVANGRRLTLTARELVWIASNLVPVLPRDGSG